MLSMRPDEYQVLSANVPEIWQFPKIIVPESGDKNIIPDLLASLPVIYDRKGYEIPTDVVLHYFFNIAGENPERANFFDLEYGLENAPDPYSRDLGLIGSSAEKPFLFLKSKTKRWNFSSLNKRLRRDAGWFIEKYIGGPDIGDLLCELRDVERMLNDMCRPDLLDPSAGK